jgi:acyl-CoA thioesterase-1
MAAVKRRATIAGVIVAVILLIWLFRPAPKVKDLDSRGAAVIAFGDSLTAGYGAPSGEDYPTHLSQLLRVPIVNAGLSGDTTETALRRLDADVLARDPRIVIVGLGGNDFLRGEPIANTEANLRKIVQQIHGAGAMVVLLGFRFPSMNANYATMYERVAKEEKCLLVTGVLSGILTDATLRSDAIHPNAKGYALMAERLAGPMRTLIRRADKARLHH